MHRPEDLHALLAGVDDVLEEHAGQQPQPAHRLGERDDPERRHGAAARAASGSWARSQSSPATGSAAGTKP